MANPLNPLEWLRTAQDWFARAERSSGFRPYLLFLIVICGVSLALLAWFRDMQEARQLAIWLIGVSSAGFIALFSIKAFQQPDFCRSETHIHRMKKLELEYMGSETEALPGEVIEEQLAIEPPLQAPQVEAGDR